MPMSQRYDISLLRLWTIFKWHKHTLASVFLNTHLFKHRQIYFSITILSTDKHFSKHLHTHALGNIFLNSHNLKHRQTFFETYTHTQTHTLSTIFSKYPHRNTVEHFSKYPPPQVNMERMKQIYAQLSHYRKTGQVLIINRNITWLDQSFIFCFVWKVSFWDIVITRALRRHVGGSY